MKTIYYKTEAIISGNLISDKQTQLYNYKLSAKEISKSSINTKTNFHLNIYQYEPIQYYIDCLMTKDENTLLYETIEQVDFSSLEIANKINIEDTQILIAKYPILLKDILQMEKYMRLLFNIPISFRTVILKIFNSDKVLIKTLQYYRNNSFSKHSFPKIDLKEFESCKRLSIDKGVFETAGARIKKAIEFYSASFESENQSIRFVLLFSAIETLFCTKNSTGVEKRLQKCVSHLLFSNDAEKEKETSELIKKLYGKRSRYIHGNTNSLITDTDETTLRILTRKTILAYMMYELFSKQTPSQIINSLINKEELDMQVMLFIVALNASTFEEQQLRLINEIEKHYGKIPDSTKQKILSKIIK